MKEGRNDITHLMPRHQVLGHWAIIRQDVHNLGICKLMAGQHILAVHLGSNHLVANICVNVVGKV